MAQARYNPVGNEITYENTIVQATTALDVAARLAIESRDSQTLTTIALAWLEVNKRMAYDEDADEQDDSKEEYRPIGFCVNDVEEEQ
jgi:hypothetical protein